MLSRIMTRHQLVSPVSHKSFFNPLLFLSVRRPFSGTPYEQELTSKLYGCPELQSPTRVVVEDRSGGCGANFFIQIESDVFRGLPRIKQHRLVQDVLKDEIAKWHAVSIETVVPK